MKRLIHSPYRWLILLAVAVLLLLAAFALAHADARNALPPPEQVLPADDDGPLAPEDLQPDDAEPPQAPLAEPEQPDLPEPVRDGENMQPDVTIIRRAKETIQEYRINGRLYMVKVVPTVGPPYYMLDSDGDGTLDVRRSDLESGLQVPQWVLFSW